jgi:hypothetical protein
VSLPTRRSGASAERRKPLKIEERGFLPKAATLARMLNRLNAEAQRPQRVAEKSNSHFSGQTSSAILCVLRASAFPGECPQKRIALTAGRRIIAINLPVVGEAKQNYLLDGSLHVNTRDIIWSFTKGSPSRCDPADHIFNEWDQWGHPRFSILLFS